MKNIKIILLFLVLICGCGTERWVCDNCNSSYKMNKFHLPKSSSLICPSCGKEQLRRVTQE